MKKQILKATAVVAAIVAFAATSFATVSEKQVPITLEGAEDENITLILVSLEGEREETYKLTVKEGESRSFLCTLSPNTYSISAEDESGNSLVLNTDRLTVTDDGNAEKVNLAVITEDEAADSSIVKFFNKISFSKMDVAALVLISLIVLFGFLKGKKKEFALKKQLKEKTLSESGEKPFSVTEYAFNGPDKNEREGTEEQPESDLTR